jgi:hypothetical protein
MQFAEKFNKPIITLIDTQGAAPGIGAEERGQGESIARNLYVMSSLKVPIVTVVIGEGGSGGALALGVADRVLMLEHSTYSVISPEGCAAILWNNGSKASEAAELLKITAQDLFQMKVIDEVVEEPIGGARDPGVLPVLRTITRNMAEIRNVPRKRSEDALESSGGWGPRSFRSFARFRINFLLQGIYLPQLPLSPARVLDLDFKEFRFVKQADGQEISTTSSSMAVLRLAMAP